MLLRNWLCAVVCAVAGCGVSAAEPLVKDGDRLAIVGDSITEQKIYSGYMEAYILACTGRKNVQVFSFGWGGDRAPAFADRQSGLYDWFRPTAMTTFFGMNDGRIRKFDNQTGDAYRKGSEKIAKFMKSKGVKLLIGSPGAVDSDMFRRASVSAADYNETLRRLGQIGAEAAAANGAQFADVHTPTMTAMSGAKAKFGSPGKPYVVLGGDGVHPGGNGHLLFAYGFLKNLGFDGNIAAIELDFASGKATVSDGLKQLSGKSGSAEFESTRYPFCFSRGTEALLAFVPFNRELNRFTLKVKNLPADKARVRFGNAEQSFSKTELEKGVNLADYPNNPFREPFLKLLRAIGAKQNYETYIYKIYLNQFKNRYDVRDPKVREAYATFDELTRAQWAKLDAQVRAEVKPVKFSISVIPQK